MQQPPDTPMMLRDLPPGTRLKWRTDLYEVLDMEGDTSPFTKVRRVSDGFHVAMHDTALVSVEVRL